MAISQKSIKQSSIALFIIEAKYIILLTIVIKVVQLQILLQKAGFVLYATIVIYTNNNRAIIIVNNSIISLYTKYIDI